MTIPLKLYPPAGSLPNGARALAILNLGNDGGIVLAYLPYNDVTPFVTWRFNATQEGYFWGHYFQQSTDAMQDFVERSGEECDRWNTPDLSAA